MDYLVGANFNIPDQAMLRWCVYIKSINPEVRHISGKKNAIADMFYRARYEDEEVAESNNEEEEQSTLAILTQLKGVSHMKNKS